MYQASIAFDYGDGGKLHVDVAVKARSKAEATRKAESWVKLAQQDGAYTGATAYNIYLVRPLRDGFVLDTRSFDKDGNGRR